MSKNDYPDKSESVAPTVGTHYGVVLPCEMKQFGEFVSGLLGKPQTIEKRIKGIFEITRQDVVNTFHLVNQRINQQNNASLVQFTVKILYDDDSSILLNSLADYEHYTEIKAISSTRVELSWTYLIQFRNKRVPEKQEINLSFASDGLCGLYGPAQIFLRVHHTDRTWGVDIESLLTGHVKTLFKNQAEIEKFINRHSDTIGISIGILFFLGAITGVCLTSLRFIDSYLAKVHGLAGDATNNAAVLSSKLDFLIEVISTGVWPRFIFAVDVFLLISLVLSVVLGIWVGSKANNRPPSYVLLSKATEERRTKLMNKLRRDWFMFIVSVVASIVMGIVSNIIFTKYFGGID